MQLNIQSLLCRRPKIKKYKEGKHTPRCNLGLGMPFGTQALPRPLTWDYQHFPNPKRMSLLGTLNMA